MNFTGPYAMWRTPPVTATPVAHPVRGYEHGRYTAVTHGSSTATGIASAHGPRIAGPIVAPLSKSPLLSGHLLFSVPLARPARSEAEARTAGVLKYTRRPPRNVIRNGENPAVRPGVFCWTWSRDRSGAVC
jgi:hypothetical protein